MLPLEFYSRSDVRREIFEFSKQRWVALQNPKAFVRYDLSKSPLRFEKEEDVVKFVKLYQARSIYSTAAKYSDFTSMKIISYTPFFDIDTVIDKWEYAVKAAEVIVSFLEKEGVSKSVYLLWSGEGIHVRINENALPKSEDVVILSHAIVKYVLSRVKDEISKLSEQSGGVLKIDDLIDDKRVFTVPLSFHKRLDLVAVCFTPNDLTSFSPDWANPLRYKHQRVWDKYEEGEAEDLAIKALSEYKSPSHLSIKAEEKESEGRIGRFQAMGILQAARYYVLYGDIDKAKSFGINRAIFYAWAKYYGRGYKARTGKLEIPKDVKESDRELKNVAGEQVYVDKESGYFIIGDKPQTPEDYDKEIKNKIELVIPYEEAWKASIDYVSSFSRDVLLNQRKFYELVYLPVRDDFVNKVVKRKKSGLDAFFSS